jgi:hypothetical protein
MHSQWAAMFAGALLVGTIAAGAIGLILLPFATFGLAVLIGVLGYTPLFTAYTYGRRVQQLWVQAIANTPPRRALAWAILGAVVAGGIPAAAGLGVFVARFGLDRLLEKF